MKTLNQLIQRIRELALAHKQIRRFKTGLAGDLFADHTAKYPACCLQYTAGNISTSGNATTVNFRMFLMDLVHVSADTKDNENDVLSDMLLIMQDMVAEMNNGNFNDWFLSSDNSLQAFTEGDNDLYAGWYMDFSIRMIYRQNVCEVPSDVFYFPDGGSGGDGSSGSGGDAKPVFDLEYIADGTQNSTLSIPEIVGMKVLLVVREGNPIHKVSSAPDPAEYTWDNSVMVLGTSVSRAGERFLILYRKY